MDMGQEDWEKIQSIAEYRDDNKRVHKEWWQGGQILIDILSIRR